ncbi:nucleolar and coiled-body phosphoprotein 1 [Chaetodon trifascialis]|uniref:nucleolar and coiled-body phosphoprotein 1 n=1 Tax=Chaetodon trifascialis TaxID=109706 RepID=UPI003991F0EA
MGSSCCHAESPCGSAEERSGLLKDESKATVATGKTIAVGACGPEGVNDQRTTPDGANVKVEVKAEAVQVKQSPEVGETGPNNTQENGPLPEVVIQTSKSSPRTGSDPKENSTRVQDEDMKDRPADGGQAELLQCTLNSLQKEHTTADWQVFTATNAAPEEENPASEEDKVPDSTSLPAKAVCPENHTETNTARERTTLSTDDNDEEEGSKVPIDIAVAETSGECSHNNEVLSVPNTQLAAAACQLPSISVVSQEIGKESPSCAMAEDPERESSSACEEAGPGVIKSHDVSESSSGSEPTGLNHSDGEERDSTNYVGEPETTALADAGVSSKSDQDAKPSPECAATSSKEVTSSESAKQDIGEEVMLKGQDKDGDVPKAEERSETEEEAGSVPTEAEAQAGKDGEIQEVTGDEEQLTGSSSAGLKADETSVTEKKGSAEDGRGNSEEDLYRGAEELSASQENKAGPPPALSKVEDRCSLDPAMDILSYSEREWKGNTAKSALIRKGYKEMSQRFGSLRRVRGDNYCALRATLFQVLSHSTQLPAWLQEEDVSMLPKQLEAQEGLISQWTFPGDCLQGDGTGDAALQLKGYMELLQNKWRAAVDSSSAAERQQLCERAFWGGEEELGLLEALKLLMLGRAVELHRRMQAGGDVPLFCWLLFARDSSDCPRSFLSNHLSHVGLSAGLEQVEMFLLGYALQCTIQVYRLYKADTEEFVTYYPDDHKDDWPSVCLVTEDDRHYNVPVVEAVEHRELSSS